MGITMNKFEILLGDALFNLFVGLKHQNQLNTPTSAPHFHIDREIHIILSGASTTTVQGKKVHSKAGDIHIVPPNASHYYEEISEDFNMISFLFTITPKWSSKKSFSEYSYYNNLINSSNSLILLHNEAVAELGRKIFSLEYCDKNIHIHQALYSHIFILIAEDLEKSISSDREIHASTAPKKSQIEKVKDQKATIDAFFANRYAEKITIKDLAKELYKSVPQTHRIVKSYFNSTFKAVLVKQRMEQACILARQGEKTMSEIALLCGYSSYNGFLSAFKKHTSLTPEEYKSSSSLSTK